MNVGSLFGLWLLMSFVCQAAEIVAWKVPLEAYAWKGIESEGMVRLEKPPEASPFFDPADELWDLSGVPTTSPNGLVVGGRLITNPVLEWVVWNASTRRLVTKGDWNSMWQMYQAFEVSEWPRMCRITLDVFETKADRSPPNSESVSVSQLSWLSRSGVSEALSAVEGHDIKTKVEATIADDLSEIDLRLNASCIIPAHPQVKIETALSLVPGERMWIARDVDGTKGIDLSVTVQIVLPDGTPFDERVLIQRGEGSRPLKSHQEAVKRYQIDGDQWLTICVMDLGLIRNLVDGGDVDATDEAAPWPSKLVMQELKLEELEVPRELIGWFGDTVWDLRKALVDNGAMADDSPSLAGFDPWLGTLFLLSRNAVEWERLEQLLEPWGSDIGSLKHVAMSLEEGAQSTRLVGRSGQAIKFGRSQDGKTTIRELEAETTIGDDSRLIDLHFAYREGSPEEPLRSGQLRLTVGSGIPVEAVTHRASGESMAPLMVKAEGVGPSGEAGLQREH